jgi:hypothetical protein
MIAEQHRGSGGPDVTDLPGAERNPPEVARQARPVFGPIERSAGARDQMQTARLIGAFSAERTRRANVF